jgi:hypothetical protein
MKRAEFEFDPASSTFRPGGTSDDPPQEDDPKCGFADARLPDRRAIVAATTLQPRAVSSLLASSAHLRAIE